MIVLLGILSCADPVMDPVVQPVDFQLTSLDRDSYKTWDYLSQTYSLHPQAPDPYDSLFPDTVDEDGLVVDVLPSFYLLRPKDPANKPQAVLFYIHGGTIADDSDFPESGLLPRGCQDESVLGLSKNKIDERLIPLTMAAARQWLIVVPRNDWCDYWLGQGTEDPQANWHFGGVHFERILNFLEKGHAGVVLPDRRFLWGSSAGGGAAAHLAVRHGGFEAIVADSSPMDLFTLYEDNPQALEFQFGGPPWTENGEKSEFWQAYADNSTQTLIASGALKTPIFLLSNAMDTQSPKEHADALIESFENYYSPAEIRWGTKDLDHPSPGSHFHVQANRPSLPAAASPSVLLDFLEGASLTWQESEYTCDDTPNRCTTGQDVSADESDSKKFTELSGAAGRLATPDDGPGIIWASPLPDTLASQGEIVALAVLNVDTDEVLPEGTQVGTLVLDSNLQHLEVPLFSESFVFDSEASRNDVITQLQSSRLSFRLSENEEARLQIEVTGAANVLLDAIIFSSFPD
jgi:pimeloyl-ACP methyl ester carboxylesterase